MKELYTSPEVKLVSFVAEERIAAHELLQGSLPIVEIETGDITLEFDVSI